MRELKIIILFLLLNISVYSQQDSLSVHYDDSKIELHQITKDDLKHYKESSDFNYVEVIQEESILTRIARWFNNMITKIFEFIFGVGNATGLLKFILTVIPYLLLAILLFLLIKFFLKVNSRNILSRQQNHATFQFTEEEQLIKNEDLNALIENAIKQQKYRLAIRYYYLLTLKKLSETHMISWEPQKTNEDYITEIKQVNLKSDFSNITRIYDYVWYGEFEVDAFKFESLKIAFESLNKTIITN